MTRAEALPLARSIAAGVCAADGCSDDFCAYMRDGSYDDHREVLAAQAALVVATNRSDLAKRKLAAVVAEAA